MFCIKCGKKAFFENLCEQCYLEGRELFEIREAKLSYCDSCRMFHTGREHMDEKALEGFFARKVRSRNRIKDVRVDISAQPHRVRAAVIVRGFIRPSRKTVEQEKQVTVHTRKAKCETCVRILGGYHEAVLQVRGPKKEQIMRSMERLLMKREVAAVQRLREGYDIKVIGKGDAARAVQAVRNKLEVKQSFKLVGEKKGRKLYRNFYSIR